jgi:mono/diheme cytochrome c family protein
MNSRRVPFSALGLTTFLLLGCAGSGGSGELAIVASSGALKGVAGDALALKVTEGGNALPSGATVAWSGVPTVVALDPSSTAASPLPAAGDAPTAAFITNPGRSDVSPELADLLFILDPGKQAGGELTLTATVTGAVTGTATVSIPVGATPAGDATRGATIYGDNGVQCSYCHGATAHGTDAGPGGMYTYNNSTYSYPAPGLNAESGNLGSDPSWNAALLAMAARADMDNGGLTLRSPMPTWLATPNPATGQPLSAQDYADLYAFLMTQTH